MDLCMQKVVWLAKNCKARVKIRLRGEGGNANQTKIMLLHCGESKLSVAEPVGMGRDLRNGDAFQLFI